MHLFLTFLQFYKSRTRFGISFDFRIPPDTLANLIIRINHVKIVTINFYNFFIYSFKTKHKGNKMKKLLVLVTLLISCATIFAQTPQKSGITDSDIKSFVQNYDEISQVAKKYGKDYSENKLSPADLKEAEDTFAKYGISSPNRTYKVTVLTAGTGYLVAKKELEADNTKAKLMQSMGVDANQAINQLKANIHKDDMVVIERNKQLLSSVKLLNQQDIQELRQNPEVKKLEEQAKKEAKEYFKNELKNNAKDTKDQLKKDGKKLLKNFMN